MSLLNNTVIFDFIRPWLLCLLIPVILATWIYISKQNTLPASWKNIFPANLAAQCCYNRLSIGRRIKQICCPLFFLLLCIVILAGPSWKQGEKTVESAPVVIAVDASNAFDFMKIKSLSCNMAEHLAPSPSALIIYSGSAHVVSSFTEDKKTLCYFIEALSPKIMPVKGNHPGEAIAQALNLLRTAGFKTGQIILITNQPENVQKAQINKMLPGKKYQLHVADATTGSILPSMYTEQSYTTKITDGQPAIKQYSKDCGVYLLPLLLIIFLSLCRKKYLLSMVLVSLSLCSHMNDSVAMDYQLAVKKAELAWKQNNYQRAACYFGLLNTADGYYNQGNALARDGKFTASIQAFNQALIKDPKHEDAQYNMNIIKNLLHEQGRPETDKQLDNTRLNPSYSKKNQPVISGIQPPANKLADFFRRRFAHEIKQRQQQTGNKHL